MALGQAMSGCVNIFNPSLLVFGGGVLRAGDLLLPGIRQAVLNLSTSLATRDLRIDITRPGETAGTIGPPSPSSTSSCVPTGSPGGPSATAAAAQRHGGQGSAVTPGRPSPDTRRLAAS